MSKIQIATPEEISQVLEDRVEFTGLLDHNGNPIYREREAGVESYHAGNEHIGFVPGDDSDVKVEKNEKSLVGKVTSGLAKAAIVSGAALVPFMFADNANAYVGINLNAGTDIQGSSMIDADKAAYTLDTWVVTDSNILVAFRANKSEKSGSVFMADITKLLDGSNIAFGMGGLKQFKESDGIFEKEVNSAPYFKFHIGEDYNINNYFQAFLVFSGVRKIETNPSAHVDAGFSSFEMRSAFDIVDGVNLSLSGSSGNDIFRIAENTQKGRNKSLQYAAQLRILLEATTGLYLSLGSSSFNSSYRETIAALGPMAGYDQTQKGITQHINVGVEPIRGLAFELGYYDSRFKKDSFLLDGSSLVTDPYGPVNNKNSGLMFQILYTRRFGGSQK